MQYWNRIGPNRNRNLKISKVLL